MEIKELKLFNSKYDNKYDADINQLENIFKQICIKIRADIQEHCTNSIKGTYFEISQLTDSLQDIKQLDAIINDPTVISGGTLLDSEIKIKTVRAKSEGYAIFNTETETIKVLAGSKCNKFELEPFPKSIREMRKQMLETSEMTETEDHYVMNIDIEFANATLAGNFVTGGSRCSYRDWTDTDDINLNNIMNKNSKSPRPYTSQSFETNVSEKYTKKMKQLKKELNIAKEFIPKNSDLVFSISQNVEVAAYYNSTIGSLHIVKGSKFIKQEKLETPIYTQEVFSQMKKDGKLIEIAGYYVFTQDIITDNPVCITNIIVNNKGSWKNKWKTEQGISLSRI